MFGAVKVSAPASDVNMMERYVTHNFYSSSLPRPGFAERFGVDAMDVFAERFSKLEREGLLTINDDAIVLTDLGRQWRRYVYYEFRSAEFSSAAFKIRGY